MRFRQTNLLPASTQHAECSHFSAPGLPGAFHACDIACQFCNICLQWFITCRLTPRNNKRTERKQCMRLFCEVSNGAGANQTTPWPAARASRLVVAQLALFPGVAMPRQLSSPPQHCQTGPMNPGLCAIRPQASQHI